MLKTFFILDVVNIFHFKQYIERMVCALSRTKKHEKVF